MRIGSSVPRAVINAPCLRSLQRICLMSVALLLHRSANMHRCTEQAHDTNDRAHSIQDLCCRAISPRQTDRSFAFCVIASRVVHAIKLIKHKENATGLACLRDPAGFITCCCVLGLETNGWNTGSLLLRIRKPKAIHLMFCAPGF